MDISIETIPPPLPVPPLDTLNFGNTTLARLTSSIPPQVVVRRMSRLRQQTPTFFCNAAGCRRSFTRADDRQRHVVEHHFGGNILPCPGCGQVMLKRSLNRHFRICQSYVENERPAGLHAPMDLRQNNIAHTQSSSVLAQLQGLYIHQSPESRDGNCTASTTVTSESASEMDEDNIDIISEQSSQNEMDRDSDFEEESIGDPGELDDDDQDGSSPDSAAEEDEFTSKRRKTQFRDFALNVEANVKKSGVVYLSTIPPGMNVSKLREMLSKYGDIGRIYLEPDQKGRPKRKRLTDTVKHGQKYLEGWVEFKKKSAAKQLAACLNNSQVGGKRRSPYYESLWNIKYLNRFKWSHLTERLVHEKATRSHRLRQEVAQAKRQSSFFSQNVEKSEMLNRLQSRKAKEGLDFAPLKKYEVKQRLTDAEIRNQQPREVSVKTKQIPSPSGTSIQNVLASLFPKKS